MAGINRTNVRQYAQALFNLSQEEKFLDQLVLDLETVNSKLQGEKSLKTILENPNLEFARKEKILRDIFLDFISHYTYNFIFLLVKRGELDLLEAVLLRLKKLMKEHYGTMEVTVTSSIKLDAKYKRAIIRKLEAKTGKKIILKTKIDPKILGGLIIQIGDDLFDFSLLEKVRLMREKIT